MPRNEQSAAAAAGVREIVLGDDPDVLALMAAGAGLVAPQEHVIEPDGDEVVLTAVLPEGWHVSTARVPAGPKTHPDEIHTTVELHDLPSWAAYVHANAASGPYQPHIYADQPQSRLTAILDPAVDDAPSWARHRATLQLAVTDDWRSWVGNSGRLMSQVDFASFVEEQAHAFRASADGDEGPHYPDAATMLEVAETFRQSTQRTFESSARLRDGERSLVYREENSAPVAGRGARSSEIKVPDRFRLVVQVWERLPIALTVEAIFRWRVRDGGQLELGYKLVRPADAQEKAWQAFLATARSGAAGDDGTAEVAAAPEGSLFVSGKAPSYGG